mgnify:FL=1|tara:strand:+ start:233 stop:394 length:162 start_codon:yes stop_codon:yes gene_type:complete
MTKFKRSDNINRKLKSEDLNLHTGVRYKKKGSKIEEKKISFFQKIIDFFLKFS